MTTKKTKTKSMIGYKAFYYDLTARPANDVVFQYKLGRRYTMKETPVICDHGFHFYPEFRDVYDYHGVEFDIRICEIKASGDIVMANVSPFGSSRKAATNRITIVREFEPREIVEMMSKVPHDSAPRLDLDPFVYKLRGNLERYRKADEYGYWILRDLTVSKAPEETRKWLDERYGKWMRALEELDL